MAPGAPGGSEEPSGTHSRRGSSSSGTGSPGPRDPQAGSASRSALTRKCPVAEAGRGGWDGEPQRQDDAHLLTVLCPGHGEILPPSPSERPRQKLSRKAASSPTCCCGQEHREVGEAPAPPCPSPPTQAQVLTFHIPHLAALGGVGASLPNRKKGTSQALLGACCVPSIVPTPRPPPSHSVPTTSLGGGRWSHAVHWPGEEAGSERVSHLPGVTQLEPGFQLNSS